MADPAPEAGSAEVRGSPRFRLRLPRGRLWHIGRRPQIMGILNVTPDSFSDGGRYPDPRAAVDEALRMLAEGADIIDVGGESTRPGADVVPVEEELRRVVPVISGLRSATDAPISVDTRSPVVGRAALDEGADVVNDVSALAEPGWFDFLPERDVPVVLMHMRGTPQTMRSLTAYDDGVVLEVRRVLGARLAEVEARGISADRIVLDPGIGFAKEPEHNLELLWGLGDLASLGRPLLVGASRKLFLGRLLAGGVGGAHADHATSQRGRDPGSRDVATVAAHTVAVLRGASILRVHNVPWARDLADVCEGFARIGPSGGAEAGSEP